MACVTLALFQWSRGTGSGPGCWRGRQELLCVSNHNKTPGDTDPSEGGRVNVEARIPVSGGAGISLEQKHDSTITTRRRATQKGQNL